MNQLDPKILGHLWQPAGQHHQFGAQQPHSSCGRIQAALRQLPDQPAACSRRCVPSRSFPASTAMPAARTTAIRHTTRWRPVSSTGLRKGLYLTATYTFCKLISTSNGEDANRDTLGAVQNQYNRRLDKSVAYNEDTPHNIHIGYTYDLPIGQGKAAAEQDAEGRECRVRQLEGLGNPHLRFRHAALDQLRPELLRRGQQRALQLRAGRLPPARSRSSTPPGTGAMTISAPRPWEGFRISTRRPSSCRRI